MGYSFEELQEQIKGMVERLPLTVESMNKMKATDLDEAKATDFAFKALASRFTPDQMENIKVDINKLIKPTRPEDKGSDLWSVFNVIQEKIIDGDFEYMIGTKVRKARKIKNFKMDIDVNKRLFEIANEFIAA
jgi:predicted component of type VI protein secretion system